MQLFVLTSIVLASLSTTLSAEAKGVDVRSETLSGSAYQADKTLHLTSVDRYWRAQLIKAGVIEENGPVRAVIPLAKVGEFGEKLTLSYGKLPVAGLHPKAVILMLHIPVK